MTRRRAHPYVWNFLGFTRPSGDPLDHVASTNRHDSLLKMDDGQRIDVDGYYLNMEWDLGSHTLFANAGKRDQDEHLPNTYTGAAPVNTITGEPLSLFDATRDTTRETTQFEARLASNHDGRFNYVVGAFQQTNDAAFCVVQVLGFIDLALDFGQLGLPQQFNNSTPSVLCNAQDSDSLAGYVDLTFDVTDKFQLGGGYRYTKDKKSWKAARRSGSTCSTTTSTTAACRSTTSITLCKRAISASIRAASTSTSRRQGSTTSNRSGRSRAGASRVRTSSATSCSPT
jgi:iron complex outermembrane receptor protein